MAGSGGLLGAYLGGEFAGGIAAGLAYTALAATRTRPAQDIELTLTEATTDAVRA